MKNYIKRGAIVKAIPPRGKRGYLLTHRKAEIVRVGRHSATIKIIEIGTIFSGAAVSKVPLECLRKWNEK